MEIRFCNTYAWLLVVLLFLPFGNFATEKPEETKKKVYLSFILHGNMNYDRYVRPTIWREFPEIYDRFLDFMDEHPDFKGQIQFSGQTFNSLKQAAPKVIEHAKDLHDKGQLNFTGTFYSEPVNINMDGETNLRCAKLGTSIIEEAFGSTDGFYLQERAYHAQLPYVLNEANVSWIPIITGDESFYPFKLQGLNGSVSVCMPISDRNKIVELIEKAPNNSILMIEDDFELPQSFSENYKKINSFLELNKDIEIEWITVKKYIEKYGVKEERYIDHSSKGKDLIHGTYSRWTADPLDIIVQDYTNKAMAAFRDATIMSALSEFLFDTEIDEPFKEANITLKHDPLIWNIEQPGLYPEVESNFLSRDGEVTILSKAEHALLWAVNSDSKGWYPLYERRRERINSLQNSEALSNEIIKRGMDIISDNISAEGYDKYYILFNTRPAREKIITLETDNQFDFYDFDSGSKLESETISGGGKYISEIRTTLPSYGYKVVGLKKSGNHSGHSWKGGSSISNGELSVLVNDEKVFITANENKIELSLDSFKVKALAEMTAGEGDGEWRDAAPYGGIRISTREGIYPQLRVEKQIDWLIHMQQTYTLHANRVLCEVSFVFPHPTLVRKEGATERNTFNPEGLTMQFKTGKKGSVIYDIPFAFTQNRLAGKSFFTPLSSGIYQFENGDGYMVTAGTGEQAFYTDPDRSEMGIYMGASTTSGPIRDVGLKFISDTNVKHEPAWYSEPFHGEYNHKFMIFPYEGTWKDNNAPAISKSYTDEVYTREFIPSDVNGNFSGEKSLIEINNPTVEITSMKILGNSLEVRLNEKEGDETSVRIKIGKNDQQINIPAHGIVEVKMNNNN